MYPVQLKYSKVFPRVILAPLRGLDELNITGEGIGQALILLNALLSAPDSVPLKAEDLTTADRDLLLAAVYRATFGPKVESTISCSACASPFDLDFSLDDLQAHVEVAGVESPIQSMDDGTFRLPSGCHFRLPTGEDELAVMGSSAENAAEMLLQRCLLAGDPASDGDAVQEAMAQVAPILQLEMTAVCPECGEEQAVRFDMQSFLLNRLKNERRRTAWEVHLLASAYRWSHREIVELPRNLRRLYVAFLET